MENIGAKDLFENHSIHLIIGMGYDISQKESAELMKEVTDLKGLTKCDESRLMGIERKIVTPIA